MKTCQDCEYLSKPAAGGGNVDKENRNNRYCLKYGIIWGCTKGTPECPARQKRKRKVK